uniref:peroxisomal membrane protein 2-like n=1 Tax=Styela clava TaxID=7725 RepID=UPI001939E61F|nr:peroxisomal membrane protein 2-like [Styela clava]
MDKEYSKKQKSMLIVLQKKYVKCLQENPILTKSITSAVLSFSANLTAQLIDIRRGMASEITLPPALRYGAFGLFVSGPVMHYFYGWLMKTVPGKTTEAAIQRLIIERLILSPFFTLLFHSFMAATEHQSWDAVKLRLQAAYWLTLTMNWKYYTIAQIINLNYIPPEMRVLFGNFCGFLWTIALTSMKPKTD